VADRSVSIALKAEVSGFVNGVRTAQRSAAGFMAELDKSAKKRAALSDLGDTAGKVGLAAAAGLGAAVVASANFDQAMSSVQAATHETASNMDLLREAALKAGAQTAFSATEAAAGIEALAKAGVSTQDIMAGGLTGALDLAAAGNLEVGAAAEYAATALTQFGLSGEQVPHVADLLAAAAGKAQGEVSDMGAALSQTGLVADMVGLSIEETTGALGAFASAGLIGSDAGTSFKNMLGSLTPNSKEAAELMGQLGINAYDAQGQFIGLADLAGNLESSLAHMSDEQRQATLETIFGADAVRAASVLYEQGADGVQSWIDKVDDSGYAAETAATRLDNLKGDIEAFTGSLETALIGAGEGSQGMLRGVVQRATDAVNAFNNLPPAAQNVTSAFLGITAVTGGALWFGAKVVQGVSNTRQALDDLNFSGDRARGMMGRLGKAATAVGIVFAGLEIAEGFGQSSTELGRFVEKVEALGGTTAEDKLASLNDELARQQKIVEDAVSFDVGAFGIGRVSPFSTRARDAADRAAQLEERIAQLNHEMEMEAIAAEKAGDGSDKAAAGFDKAGDAARRAADGTRTFSDSLKRMTGFLDERGMLREYQAALDDMTKSVRQNGRSFDINTEKGRSNQAALDAIARSAIDVGSSMSDADRVGFLRRSAGDIRRVAREMGLPRDAVQEVIGKLQELGRQNPKPKVTVDTTGANAAIASVTRSLDRIQDETVNVWIRRHGTPGGRIDPGIRPASGGYITGPGTATSDSIPAHLSNGEYVVRAAAVDRYGVGFLHDVNAMRFANGGAVGGGDDPRDDRTTREVRRAKEQAKRDAEKLQRKIERQIEHVKETRDEMRELRKESREFGKAVAGNFRTDPFESNATLGGVIRSLQADTAGARDFNRYARRARRLGLSGGALEAILASGNGALLGSIDTRGEVRRLEAAWGNRNQATGQLAAFSSNAWLDRHGKRQTDTTRELNQVITRLNKRIDRLDERLERAVRRGARDGTSEGGRRANRRRQVAMSRASLS
jgi:TP901 family phage tail tape measure protein